MKLEVLEMYSGPGELCAWGDVGSTFPQGLLPGVTLQATCEFVEYS